VGVISAAVTDLDLYRTVQFEWSNSDEYKLVAHNASGTRRRLRVSTNHTFQPTMVRVRVVVDSQYTKTTTKNGAHTKIGLSFGNNNRCNLTHEFLNAEE